MRYDRDKSWVSLKEAFKEILHIECPSCGALKNDACSNVDSGDYVSPHPERIEAGFREKPEKKFEPKRELSLIGRRKA